MAASLDSMREESDRKSRKRSRDIAEEQTNQNSTEEPDQHPPKLPKTQNGREFQKSIKDGDGNLQDILKDFLVCCRDSVPESGDDVIMQYLKVSPQCEELLDLLNDENRPNLVIVCTLRIITTALLRFAENQSKYGVVALHIVRRLVRVHFGIVMKFLNLPKDFRCTKTVLRLLTVIVTLGKQCAQELLSMLNLDHPSLQKLAQIRRSKEKEDPRTHFVQFSMALFMTGSSDIIDKAVASKEFCRSLFHHIATDRLPIIQLILTTLKDKVLNKSLIPKKSKKLLFNNFTLSQLIELYDLNKPAKSDEVDIPHMVHNFLQLVCCSHKHGICYSDESLGIDGRVANSTLLRFLSSFKTTSILNDPLMEDLFISIFKVCPDLLTPYLKERSSKFTPRPFPDWLNNIILFEKIYNCLPDVSPALMKNQRTVAVSRLLDLVTVTTLPFMFTREEYAKNFKGMCIPVHFGLLKICKIYLQRSLKIITFCREQMKQPKSILSREEWTEFIELLGKSVREILPDAEFFVGMYEKYQTYLRSENREEESYQDWVRKEIANPVPIPKPDVVMCGILDILLLQQKLFPNCLEGLSVDLNSVFAESLSVLFIKNLSDEENLSILIVRRLMEFLAGIPTKKILWFKENKRSGSIFSQVLTLLLSSKLVQSEAEQLLCKILMETGHFENNKEEALAWLVTLYDLSKADQVGVIDLLRKSLVKVVRNPHPFNDRITDAMTKALQMRDNDAQSETASVAEAGIAAILDQEEYTIEAASTDLVTMETSLNSDSKNEIGNTMYCSALLPAALEEFFNLLSKGKGETALYMECCWFEVINVYLLSSGGGFEKYITSVALMIINQQRDPFPISILIQDCHQTATEKIKTEMKFTEFDKCLNYCQFWLQQDLTSSKRKRKLDLEAVGRLKRSRENYTSFSELLQDSFVIGSETSCDADIVSSLTGLAQSLPAEKVLPGIRQVMLYMENVMDKDTSRLQGILVFVLYILLQRSKEIDEEVQEPPQGLSSNDDSSNKPASKIPWDAIAHSLFENGNIPSWTRYGTSLSFPEDMRNDLGSSCLQKHFLTLLEHFFADVLPSEHFQRITDEVFSQVSSECYEKLASLEEGKDHSAWREYYELSDWLQHVDSASPRTFQGICCKILSMLSSDSNDSSQTLIELFIALPKLIRTFPKSALMDFVQAVELQQSSDLDKALCLVLDQMPDVNLSLSTEMLNRCLAAQDNKETYSHLQQSLILNSVAHRIHFAQFCSSDDGQRVIKKRMKKEPLTFLPVIYSYLSLVAGRTERYKQDKEAVNVIQDLVWSRLVKAYQEEGDGKGEDSSDRQLRLIQEKVIAVIVKVVSTDKLKSQTEKICSKEQNLNRSMLHLLMALINELSSRQDGDVKQTRSEIFDAILISSVGCSFSLQLLHYEKLISILEMTDTFEPSEAFVSNFKHFIQDGLKNHYRSSTLQKLLKRLVYRGYQDEAKEVKGLIPLKKIFHMIISHSLFLPTMMGDESGNDTSQQEARDYMISTLLFIARRAPSCCSLDHVVVWLGAYSGTRSSSDRMLLEMLELYEKNDISLNDYRPFLWGQPAVTQHAARKTLGKSLWTQPTMKEVLNLLDPSKMLKSILQFPLDQPLSRQEIGPESVEPSDMYDPSFLLPLFSSLLGPECLADCFSFIQCNGLFMTVVALSSNYKSMREAAYHVLALFDQHLDGARFRGRREISYLLTCLKNTVPEPNARLPSVTTMFVGRSFEQMLDASGPLFKHILQYTALEPKLPLNLIPAFNGLFFSTSEKHEMEREWMLTLLEDGLRDYTDFVIFVRNNLWSLLLGLASSPHCSQQDKRKVITILKKAVCIPPAALSLVSNHSLMTWMLMSTRTEDDEESAQVISILEVTWKSIVDLWKKDQSMDLEKVISKLSEDIFINCQSVLRNIKSPSLELLRRIMSLMQRVHQELEGKGAVERKQYLSENAMFELVKIYFQTTNDPGFITLVRPAKEDDISTDMDDHQDWIKETLNKEIADVLYYLIYHWLKSCKKAELTNHSVSNCGTKVRLQNQSLLSVCICWSLRHFVRRDAQLLPEPHFSEHLDAISAVLKTNPEEAEKIAKEEIKDGVIRSCLSIYHYLGNPDKNCCLSCLDNAEWLKVLHALNQLLLYLTKFIKISKPFKSHLKPWSKVKHHGTKPVQSSHDQERLSVLLQELWAGSDSPSCYENLPTTSSE